MKKLLFVLAAFFLMGSVFAYASTVYLPTESSSQYLPTVKIFAYSFSYDGSLTGEAYGSGTLIDGNGTILTNNHVIESYWDPSTANDAFQICLTRSNNTEEPVCEFTANLIARDKDRDLALLKMDRRSVDGESVNFDFYLPYDNESAYNVGDTVTVIGYPDTGGRTITYTSGLISGLITEGESTYIKTDADISFGNSGGTAVDDEGNLIGVPTYIVGSYSSEVLGYLYPVEDAVSWIKSNISKSPIVNELANAELKEEILRNVNANTNGTYENDYPPFSVSVIDDWKFGNSLEGAFEGDSFGSYYGADNVVIYPKDNSDITEVYIEISVSDYSYDVTLEDIEGLVDEYQVENLYEEGDMDQLEVVDFNGYEVVKEVYNYYDWWFDEDVNTVTYYLPYGDKVVNIYYSYLGSDSSRVSEIDAILATFEIDMSAIKLSTVDSISSEDPVITVTNPLENVFLSDETYYYDGVNYFGASFGKKADYDFYIDIYSNEYYEESYIGDFEAFKKATLDDANEWYDVIASGTLTIDGHQGFYYTDEYYDDWSGETDYYTTVYIYGDEDTYFTIYYSNAEDAFKENLVDFKRVLRSIEFESAGEGVYLLPTFITSHVSVVPLSDIKNYLYEDSIRSLDDNGAFADSAPVKFNPAGNLTRKDFLVWAIRTMPDDLYGDYAVFADNYEGCGDKCFADVNYEEAYGKMVDFAKTKGAVGGLSNDGKFYFAPDNQISLAAALKIVCELNEVQVWEAPDFVPWYIPYLHYGYENYLIPYGVNDVNYLLSRGEGAYILDGMIYASDYYYDDYWY